LPVTGTQDDLLPSRQFYAGDLKLYADFEHLKGWNRTKVRQFLDKKFKNTRRSNPSSDATRQFSRRTTPLFSDSRRWDYDG
jgi:hypothetical protein